MADLALYENFLEHARVMESILNRRRSVALRKMELGFEIPDAEFVGLFRLNKGLCRDLIQELEPYLPTRRGGISVVSKVLSALSFYASGSYQRFVGASAHHKMHQVSVSNCMRAVTLALNNDHFRNKYIRFPQTREERNVIKNGFYQKFGIPGTVGCIDGSHIAIVRPAQFEERFINRKRYHSLNAQVVCDSDLTITSIDASHEGANHDSFIWNHHPLKQHLERIHREENETLWFLGDSGYPLRPTLMTPIVNTEPDSPQRYYTDLHCRARNTVERCIGVLKSRWRCLLVDRKLHYHPTTAGLITNACVVLHNICNVARLPVPPLTPQEEQREITMQGEIDSRLMSAILTGVKRAYPFADKERVTETAAQLDAVHKLVHLAGLSVAVHALALLFHVSDASKGISDRYYTALYRKLTNAEIFGTTHSALLFSLIYKSLKQDKNIDRVTAFVKRLLQLCCYMTPAQACGMLFLISQVLKDGDKKDAVKLVWTKQEIKEEEVKNEKEETAEVKENEEGDEESRTEENGTADEDDEKEDKVEQKKVDLLHGDKRDLLLDDDEEETYVDLKIDEAGNIRPKKRRAQPVTAGWFHARVKNEKAEVTEEKEVEKKLENKIQLKRTVNMDKVISEYNPFTRNPSFAGANRSAYVELLPLAAHFHPTVKLFAEKLLNEQLIQYSGDPLKDFAGIRFLDRFVFKNPKRRDNYDGEVKKVKGSHPKFAIRKNYTAKGLKSIPVNSSTYLNEDVKKIPVDEKFLYDFLQKRRSAKDPDDSDSDDDSVTSEDFEQYLDTVTGSRAKADSDEELDFLAEMEKSKQTSSKKNKETEDDNHLDELGSDGDDDDIGDDAGSDDGDSDGELNISGDENEPTLSGDEEEMLLQDSDDEDNGFDMPGDKKGKGKLKLKGKDNLGSLFASAEEFSTLLEETATNKKQGSSQAVSNTDNSSTKQLAWEENRDKWIKGFNRKIFGGKKGGNKKFNKKPHGGFNKMADSKKGGKRNAGHSEGAGGKRKRFK